MKTVLTDKVKLADDLAALAEQLSPKSRHRHNINKAIEIIRALTREPLTDEAIMAKADELYSDPFDRNRHASFRHGARWARDNSPL